MKYSLDESMREVSARSRRLRKKRSSEALSALSAATLALFIGLVASVRTAAGPPGAGDETSVFGAFVLPNAAGGYILAGVIAFALGVVFTLLCIGIRKRKTISEETNDDSVEKEEQDEEKL